MARNYPGILVGDPGVGKSLLLTALSYGPPVTYYWPPTLWPVSSKCAELFISDRHFEEPTWDAYFPIISIKMDQTRSKAGGIETVVIHDVRMPNFHVHDASRHFIYDQIELFLLCFDISKEVSLRNVVEKWHPELVFRSPTKPFILVGCKSDLRQPLQPPDANISSEKGAGTTECVSEATGRSMAKRIGAIGYIECSATKRQNIDKLRDAICRLACRIATPSNDRTAARRSPSQCVIA